MSDIESNRTINGTSVPDGVKSVNGFTLKEVRALRQEPTAEGLAWAKKSLLGQAQRKSD